MNSWDSQRIFATSRLCSKSGQNGFELRPEMVCFPALVAVNLVAEPLADADLCKLLSASSCRDFVKGR